MVMVNWVGLGKNGIRDGIIGVVKFRIIDIGEDFGRVLK